MAQAVDESKPRFSFKMGTAPTIGSTGKQGARESMMLGLEYSRPFATGALYFAAEYRIFRATQYEVTPFGEAKGYALDGSGRTGMITQYRELPNGRVVADGRFDSVDYRRSDLDGITTKIGYRHNLGAMPVLGNLSLQGGLTLAYLSGEQYSTGSINVLEFRNQWQEDIANQYQLWLWEDEDLKELGRMSHESFLNEHQVTKFSPGIFVGARTLITDNLFFEVNVSMLGYSEINYVPASYTEKRVAYTETSNHVKTVLEFSAGLRF
jgi:hypothetical protein